MARDETSSQKTYLHYILAYTVTLGIGLAPVLGKVRVPLFSPIAEVFPANLQRGLVPFATFLMAIPVICVHFYSRDRIRIPSLDRLFKIVVPAVIVLPLLLFYLYSSWVVQVDFEGGRQSAAYVVGEQMLPDCPCVIHKLDLAACVAELISANPAAVTACYPRRETNARRAGLAIVYLLLMFGLGTLIALVILKETQRQRPSAAARRARSR
jgi:hypothetical protein